MKVSQGHLTGSFAEMKFILIGIKVWGRGRLDKFSKANTVAVW